MMSLKHNELVNKRLLEGEQIDLKNLAYSLWDNKLVMLIIMLATIIPTMIYSSVKAPQYEANTILKIENKTQEGLSSTFAQHFDPKSTNDSTASQIALIQSRFILEPVVQELGLSINVKKHHSSLFSRLLSSSNEYLSVKQLVVPQNIKYLTLKVTDATHYQLFDINQTLLLEGKADQLSANSDHSITAYVTMKATQGAQFDIVKNSASDQIQKLKKGLHIQELGPTTGRTGVLEISLKDTNPVRLVNILNTVAKVTQEKDIERKSLEIEKTLSFVKQQLPLAKKSLQDAEIALNRYRAISGKLDIKMEIQKLLSEQAEIEKQITRTIIYKADLLQRFTEENPVIMGINDKLKQLKKQKSNFEKEMKLLPASDQIALNFMRDIKVKNQIYLTLLNKLQQIEVSKASTVSDVRMLASANLPEAALPKQLPLMMAISIALGFVLTIIFVLMRKILFQHVNDPQWVELNLNLSNLAIIPYSNQQTTNVSRFKTLNKNHLEILAEKYPRDLSIEALRSLRTSLQLLLVGSSNNIIAIMGASPGIGKSFVSVNLAFLLADIGKRILLIDGDIRKGHLNNYFDLPQAPGLTEVMTRKANIKDVIYQASDTFNFLSCGSYPKNPAELLTKQGFHNIIDNVSKSYDLVMIDTAPILAVTDSLLIGSLASVNLLVLGSGVHQPAELMLTLKQLKNAGIQINGTIFNALKQKKGGMYGGYRYNYSSYYESETLPSHAN